LKPFDRLRLKQFVIISRKVREDFNAKIRKDFNACSWSFD